ncbi:MAG: hypothetical protein ABIQ56_00310 [Chitinophagaceae bacterium]
MKHLSLLLFISMSFSIPTFSQFKLGKLGDALKKNKGVSKVLEGTPAISTCFADVNTKDTKTPTFGEGKTYKPLSSLKKNEAGNYLLEPGFYETTNLSYCLKVGTPGPAKGNVYGLAPLNGKMDDIVYAILLKSQQMWLGNNADSLTGLSGIGSSLKGIGGIKQKDVQLLLWGIIAKADFTNLSGRTKAVAAALLTPDQLLKLNGGAIKTVSNLAMDKGWLEKPEALRKIEMAQHSIRDLYRNGNSTFEDFERLAVLVGDSDEEQGLPTDMWFKHPNGYYVRFMPRGYPRTLTQVYVPDGNHSIEFINTGFVATPTDSRQRLAQTNIPASYYDSKFKL